MHSTEYLRKSINSISDQLQSSTLRGRNLTFNFLFQDNINFKMLGEAGNYGLEFQLNNYTLRVTILTDKSKRIINVIC